MRKEYLPFEEAREFVRSLNLKSQKEWAKFAKSEKRPVDIPSNPNSTYKGKGWIDLGDWLGTRRISNRNRKFLPFEEARDFARSLKLKSQKEWLKFTKSGNLPEDIPAYPNGTYKDQGWAGMGDWLGY